MNEPDKWSLLQTATDTKTTLGEYSKLFTGIRNDLNGLLRINKEVVSILKEIRTQFIKHTEERSQ